MSACPQCKNVLNAGAHCGNCLPDRTGRDVLIKSERERRRLERICVWFDDRAALIERPVR